MKRLLSAFSFVILSVSICWGQVARGQNTFAVDTIQTGFAQITPIQGDTRGLGITEVITHQFNGNVSQSSMQPSPLVTLTDVVVNVDSVAQVNTGIAIVNPTEFVATVAFSLVSQHGFSAATRTITMGSGQQASLFVTEIFPGLADLSSPVAGLLFISSDIPVSVLGLVFNGLSFAALPVAAQLSPVSASNFIGNIIIVTPSAIFNTVGSALPPTVPPLPSNIIGIPSGPITTLTPPVAPTGAVSTAFGPNNGGTAIFTTNGTTVPRVVAFDSFIFPQIVSGGGWSSQITIINGSTVPKTLRIDFFDSTGAPLNLPIGSTVNVVVPARGVFIVSTQP